MIVASKENTFSADYNVPLIAHINPSRPGPGQRENFKFLFSHFFVVQQKVLRRL